MDRVDAQDIELGWFGSLEWENSVKKAIFFFGFWDNFYYIKSLL